MVVKVAKYKEALVEKIEKVGTGLLRVDERYLENDISPRAIETEAEKLGIDTKELYAELIG